MNGGTEITEIKLDQNMIAHLMHMNDKMKMDLDQVNGKISLMEKKVSELFQIYNICTLIPYM